MSKKNKLWVVFTLIVGSMLACNLPASAPPTEVSEPPTAATILLETPTSALPTATQCLPSITTNRDSNVRKGPGQAYDKLGFLPQGASAFVAGKSNDGTWWYIQFAGGENGYGWISGSIVTANCIPTTLAVVAAPPIPASQPKLTKTPQPSNNNGNNTTNPTETPPQSQPDNTGELLFKIDFDSVWYCGSQPMISAKFYNIGSANIESAMSSVEVNGTYINTTGNINNSPFKFSATESDPNCTQTAGGRSSLAPSEKGFIHISIASIPAAGTEGFLYVEACTDNNHNGTCTGQFVYFKF